MITRQQKDGRQHGQVELQTGDPQQREFWPIWASYASKKSFEIMSYLDVI